MARTSSISFDNAAPKQRRATLPKYGKLLNTIRFKVLGGTRPGDDRFPMTGATF
jgi:hypothetical protein